MDTGPSLMNTERLATMAHFLETLYVDDHLRAHTPEGAPFLFKMNVFYTDESFPQLELSPDCNTAACALGSAALCGVFDNDLKIEIRRSPDVFGGARVNAYFFGTNIDPTVNGFRAAASLFGISESASCFLFDPVFYPPYKITPQIVARRIRLFLKIYPIEEQRIFESIRSLESSSALE